eukprot:s2829_g5.t1
MVKHSEPPTTRSTSLVVLKGAPSSKERHLGKEQLGKQRAKAIGPYKNVVDVDGMALVCFGDPHVSSATFSLAIWPAEVRSVARLRQAPLKSQAAGRHAAWGVAAWVPPLPLVVMAARGRGGAGKSTGKRRQGKAAKVEVATKWEARETAVPCCAISKAILCHAALVGPKERHKKA